MKVLFCVDGSEYSFFAIKKALSFLHPDDHIEIIYVIDWGFLPTYITFPQEKETIYPENKSVAENVLDKTAALIESNGFKVAKVNCLEGQPAKIILETINTEKYNLVVLGSHGKKGLRKWIGSVSRKVITKSGIPSLIVKYTKEKEEKDSSTKSKNVLFAIDGSECSYNAITKAIALLNMDNSSVKILTVNPGTESLPVEVNMDSNWLQDYLKKQNEMAIEILEQAKLILLEKNILLDSALSLEGDPAEVLLDYTDKNKQDLIIMGSHGREGISDFILGSVSKRVLDNSTSPVLIVPTKKTGHKN